jgi:hypothetical protein
MMTAITSSPFSDSMYFLYLYVSVFPVFHIPRVIPFSLDILVPMSTSSTPFSRSIPGPPPPAQPLLSPLLPPLHNLRPLPLINEQRKRSPLDVMS